MKAARPLHKQQKTTRHLSNAMTCRLVITLQQIQHLVSKVILTNSTDERDFDTKPA